MLAKSFYELKIWQEARLLTIGIYKIMHENRDFGFKDQIQRASVSIMNNIAEGFGSDTDSQLIRYFQIAKASATEVYSMLLLAHDLNYIKENQVYLDKVEYIIRGIQKFILAKK